MASIQRPGTAIEVDLSNEERRLLLGVIARLGEQLDQSPLSHPRAYEDEELEAEYHRLVRPELVRIRSEDVGVVRTMLRDEKSPLRLDEAQALTWTRALNHLRLAAGNLLGIEEDGWDAEAGPDLVDDDDYAVLTGLGWLQEALVEALGVTEE